MTSIIEKAARAAYADNDWWQVVKPDDDGLGRYKDHPDYTKLRAVEWEELDALDRAEFISTVRAVLLAIRVPDDAILDAMSPSGRYADIVTPDQWAAAIDSILKEGT